MTAAGANPAAHPYAARAADAPADKGAEPADAPSAVSDAARAAADRAYADLQTALDGPPLYKSDVAPYNQGVTQAYNRWVEAETAAFGPAWREQYVALQTVRRAQSCKTTGQAEATAMLTAAPAAPDQAQINACLGRIAAAPVRVPALQALLVVDDGRFHDYAAPASPPASASQDPNAGNGDDAPA